MYVGLRWRHVGLGWNQEDLIPNGGMSDQGGGMLDQGEFTCDNGRGMLHQVGETVIEVEFLIRVEVFWITQEGCRIRVEV